MATDLLSTMVYGKVVTTVKLISLLLPQVLGEGSVAQCFIMKSLPILHQYYQLGDVLIAGIMSQGFIFSNQITFVKKPSEELFDEYM